MKKWKLKWELKKNWKLNWIYCTQVKRSPSSCLTYRLTNISYKQKTLIIRPLPWCDAWYKAQWKLGRYTVESAAALTLSARTQDLRIQSMNLSAFQMRSKHLPLLVEILLLWDIVWHCLPGSATDAFLNFPVELNRKGWNQENSICNMQYFN